MSNSCDRNGDYKDRRGYLGQDNFQHSKRGAVTKNNGGKIEGYLVKKDERGTTIGFMGGSNQFIQALEIRF